MLHPREVKPWIALWAKDSADIPVEQLALLSYFPSFAGVDYPVSLASNQAFSSEISLDP